jgi:hypothetical protein
MSAAMAQVTLAGTDWIPGKNKLNLNPKTTAIK